MYYFSEINIRGNHAGTKARNDVEEILKRSGAIPINKKSLILKSDENEKIYSNIRNRFDFVGYFVKAKMIKNEIIFIQYPMLSFDKDKEYVELLSKKNRVVLLVHDIHSLRRGNYEELKKEIDFLNLADIVILHNRYMEDFLIKSGLKVNCIYNLNIFDYLYAANTCSKKETYEADIVFAGNLGKSIFLDQFIKENSDLGINLYGVGYREEWNKFGNIKYCGNFDPNIIPSVLNGKYGLIWDGDTIETCSGFLGEYTKLNNPHKLSLYVAAGIPVIAWKHAAIVEYVKNNNIGIIVDSLTDIKEIIKHISERDYDLMCNNVQLVRNDLINGNNLNSIIQNIKSGDEVK